MDHRKNIEYVSQGKATKFPLYILKETNQPDTDFHSHEFVELVLIQSGTAVHQLNSGKTHLQRGDIFVIPRGTYHGYTDGCQLDLINILYIPEMLPMVQMDAAALRGFDAFYKGTASNDGSCPFLHLPEEDFQILEKYAQELCTENTHRHSGYQFNMMGLFMTLLCRLARLYANQPDTGKNADELGVVIAYIHSNFRKKITLEQLCRKANMSRSSLMRAFSRTAGVAPLQYQLQLRISEAIQLLLMTRKSLGSIAFEVGFSDSNYFGRQFKKITGSSPMEYRKNAWK